MSKTAFLFPGQGAQSIGMGQQLAESLPAARALFDDAEQVLGYDLARLCANGPVEELDSTIYSQPALFVCSLAAVEQIRSETPEIINLASAAAGLSLGEYTALVFAGVMEFEHALRVVKCRGEAMQAAADATPSGMVSVLGLELAQVEDLCEQSRQPDEVLRIANHLCPGNIVVSGHNASCEKLVENAESAGAMKVVALAVAGAFHTPIMESALEQLAEVLAEVPMASPRIPVISNVDAQPHSDPEEIREILVKQVVSPVRWEDSMRLLLDDGYSNFYEVGPGRVLRGLLRRIDRKVSCTNVG
ncbi:MAG: [acyl-carrier-protein] S-malonyltransferase [Planctomycetaceae bacterium]|nr:[acyl-carrier-protein] S-malonyltransferase [Planctomycetaceae bacterium]